MNADYRNRGVLDIIIPTKNRYTTLVPSVRAMLSNFGSADFRIIIYDNTPVDTAVSVDEILNDHRIRYFHDLEDLDAVENFNRAIDLAESDFSILIGDDDFVLPTIFDAINSMISGGVDCLIQRRPAYYWENVKFGREFEYFAPKSLIITREINKLIYLLDPVVEIDKVLDMGGIYLYNLPALYHGILRTSVLKSIKKNMGNYVFGPSPDMSLALIIAQYINSYGVYGTPFSIAGASFNSAAGMGRRGEHSATLERAPSWLPRKMLDSWDPSLPRIWNGFTVYAQSLYLVGKIANIPININYESLYLKILTDNFWDIKYLVGKSGLNRMPSIFSIVRGLVVYAVRSVILSAPLPILNMVTKCRPYFKTQTFYKDVSSPEACIGVAIEHIKKYAVSD